MPDEQLPPPPQETLIEVIYPPGKGTVGLRGDRAPLSWEHTEKPAEAHGDRHLFRIPVPPGEILELKLVRNEEDWAAGRNYVVHAGDHLHLEPCFERQGGTLQPLAHIDGEMPLAVEVFLPPSYGEQESKRYPVLYCLDGQSLWSTSQDPFGVWNLDLALNTLWELGAIEEIIVVGVHTAEQRLERLSPVADAEHGGGEGPKHLQAIADRLRPWVNSNFRTRTDRDDTAILGSSMGGLFAFFAAWTRPDVFGSAACLSSSFWWADRYAVRRVTQGEAPSPRPRLYIDSGAALNPGERDVNARDGFHHSRSMFRALTTRGYTPGVDLHRMVFTGATHDAASWSERVGIPLQLLFAAPIAKVAAAAR